ncbi:MAG: hypothetical protein MUC49_13550 [Raineya sp.]|jgi:hypothetical protein|nr:hypothetical protein [Raineya sp.]
MIRSFLYYSLILFCLGACAVDVTPNDSKAYIKFIGSSRDEIIKSIQPTSDGGFILVGSTTSFRDKKQDLDFYIAKVDQNGDKQWQHNWGLKLADEANAVMEMPNGDFWVLGYTTDTLETASGRTDFTLHIRSANGDSLSTRYFKIPNLSSKGKFITKMSDTEFLLAGDFTQSETTGSGQSIDMRAYKVNANGNLLDTYTALGIQTDDILVSIVKDSDKLLWLGDMKRQVQNPTIPKRIRIAFTDLFGNIGGDYIFREQDNVSSSDKAEQVIYDETSKTCVVVGTTSDGSASKDVCLLKFSVVGEYVDETSINFKRIEKAGEEEGKGIYATSDGGFIIVGTKLVKNEDTDIYLLKIDAEGNEQWSKTFGGAGLDEGVAVRETPDGGFLVVANVLFKNNKVAALYKTDKQGVIFK